MEATEMIFRAAIKLEEIKKEKEQIARHLAGLLDIIEAKFESNENEFTDTQLEVYIDAANFIKRAGLQRRALEHVTGLKF